MIVQVYDRHDVYLGSIEPAQLIEMTWTDELNGADAVDISTTWPLEEGQRLVWADDTGTVHEHICQDPAGVHDGGDTVYTDTALNSISEIYGDYIEEKRPYGYSYRLALETALESTRWEVGTVDQAGTVGNLSLYHTSAREAVQSIVELGGELETVIETEGGRVTARKVSILARRGNAGGRRRLVYGKDVTSITRTTHTGAITACYGYGKGVETESGGYSRKLTFGDINGGLDYVEDLDALAVYGRPDGAGGMAHVFGIYENSECEDAAQLLEETREYLDEHAVPGVSYEVDAADLTQYGRDWEGVGVGDTVQIVDSTYTPELRLSGRVTKVVRDLLGGGVTVTIGNITDTLGDLLSDYQRQVSSLATRSGSWDVAAASTPSYLQQLLDGLNYQFNLNGMSYQWTSLEQGTIYASVPLDESGRATEPGGWAMQLSSKGFRIASGTTESGEWDWTTYGTGEGFTSSAITSGILRAGRIEDAGGGGSWWDLDSGELHLAIGTTIGDSTVATSNDVIAVQAVADAASTAASTAQSTAASAQATADAATTALASKVDQGQYDSDQAVIASQFTQVNATSTGIQTQITSLLSDQATVNAHFIFGTTSSGDPNMILSADGTSTSAFQTSITNTAVSFLYNGTEVASAGASGFSAPKMETDTLKIGGYAIKMYETSGLEITWVGV